MAATVESQPINVPTELSQLSGIIDQRVQCLAQGDEEFQKSALSATKYLFDLAIQRESDSRKFIAALLNELAPSQAPQTRSQARAAAASGQVAQQPTISHAITQPTPLASLFVDSMDEDQVWAQLDLKAKNVCETLKDAFDTKAGEDAFLSEGEDGELEVTGLEDDEDDEEFAGMDFGDEGEDSEDEDMESMEDHEDEEEDDEDEHDDGGHLGEGVMSLRDPSDEDDDDEDGDKDVDANALSAKLDALPPKKRKRGSHPELDDGFFNLAEFNAEVEAAESRKTSSGRLNKGEDSDSDEGDEDIDLFVPMDDAEGFEEGDDDAAGESFYKDFFEPPPRPAKKPKKTSPESSAPPRQSKVRFHEEVKVRNIKSQGKGKKLSAMPWDLEDDDDEDAGDMFGDEEDMDEDEVEDEDEDEEDEEEEDEEEEGDNSDEETMSDAEAGLETIQRLKDDLFAEDEEDKADEGSTTHEKRMLALREQIAQLEADNVARKDWTMMGEATSRSRPINALLEEDLEYDRAIKTVPVVTDEVIRSLEERIKTCILENNFNDVVRKRPMDDKPFLPSRVFELQDKKSTQSLAQIYENEYMATQGGGSVADDRDGKLKKQHDEIEKLWEDISYKLDALCNAHFTPKQPKAMISTVTNVSTVTLESALPTTKSISTVLAPEEVYAASSSQPRDRSEMTPGEKRAQRARERKLRRKQRGLLDKSVDKFAKKSGDSIAKGGVKKQKDAALKSLVKSGKGVTVIGKKSQEVNKGKKGAKGT